MRSAGRPLSPARVHLIQRRRDSVRLFAARLLPRRAAGRLDPADPGGCDPQAAHYHLPAFTSYNGAAIPFGYSPLGFYLAGLLDDWTPLTLVDAIRRPPTITCPRSPHTTAPRFRSAIRRSAFTSPGCWTTGPR